MWGGGEEDSNSLLLGSISSPFTTITETLRGLGLWQSVKSLKKKTDGLTLLPVT